MSPQFQDLADYVEMHFMLRYWMSVNSISTLYSAIQLFKCIWDIAFKSSIISNVAYDYITFSLDQV